MVSKISKSSIRYFSNSLSIAKLTSPSISVLEKKLTSKERLLQADDMELASKICYEISTKADQFKSINFADVSRVNGFTERILIFNSDIIDIRAHLECYRGLHPQSWLFIH